MQAKESRPASLVTGGAGFIGSYVARHCVAPGHRVVVLDDLSGGFADQVPDGAELVVGSVTDQSMLSRLFRSCRRSTSELTSPTQTRRRCAAHGCVG